VIDLAPLIEPLIMILGTALSVIGLWAIRWLGTKNKVLADTEVRNYLQTALLQGLGLGIERTREFVKERGTVAVRSALVAEAAQYVLAQVPGALRHFKIDEVGVKRMLEARLPLIDPPTMAAGESAQPASAGRIPDDQAPPTAPLILPNQEG